MTEANNQAKSTVDEKLDKPSDQQEQPSPQPEGPPTPSASDLKSPGEWFNSYFGSDWVSKAKEQTMNTLESVKKDLNEFTDTVQHEVSAIANASAKTVKQQAELFQQFVTTPDAPDTQPPTETTEKPESGGFGLGWMKSVVDTVKSLTIEDTAKEEESFTEPLRFSKRNTALDQFQLLEFQNDESTFIKAPTQNIEVYKEWLKDFRLSEYNGEINILLSNNPKLRELYAKIVPSKIDNHTFWNRYFFKVYVAEMEKELRMSKGKVFEQLTVDTAGNKTKNEEKKGESEVSPANTENESWSVCSSGADDLQEIPDEIDDKPAGQLTPKAEDDSSSPPEWEKWDEKEGKSEQNSS